MELAEKFYKAVTSYKNINNRKYANHASHKRKRKVMESASPINPKKGCIINHKKKYADHPRNWSTGDKICLLHGTGHST